MLFIFNETSKSQWKVSEKNPSFLRLENKQFPHLGFDILSRDIKLEDFNKDALDTSNSTKDLREAMSLPTAIRFETRGFKPFVIASKNEYNADIILASFDLEDDLRLINHFTKFAYVYDAIYDFDKHILHIIFSLNHTKPNSYLQEVFTDAKDEYVFRRCFRWNEREGKYTVNSRSMKIADVPKKGERGYFNTNDYSTNHTVYNISKYRPARPTNTVIIFKPSKVDECKKLLEDCKCHTERMNIMVAEKNFRKDIKNATERQHISAVTYYIDDMTSEEIREHRDEVLKNLSENRFANFFKLVYALGTDGKIIKLVL